MMTKKHFIAIAAAIAAEGDDESTTGKYETLDSLTERLALVFKADNPNFNRVSFINATK